MLPSATRPLGCTDTTVPGGWAPVTDRTTRGRSPRPARYSRTVPTGRPSRAAALTLTVAGPWVVAVTGGCAAPPPARASSHPARATSMAAASAATHRRRPGRGQRRQWLEAARAGYLYRGAAERGRPGQAFVRHDAEGVQVTGGSGGLAGGPLRGQVGRSAHEHACLGEGRGACGMGD